jgi:acyl-CoA dehydrogenase family protein 9
MRKALKETMRSAKAARVLILSGLLLYGASIARGQTAKREFLLRRITTLSLYTFGLLALLCEAERKKTGGVLGKEDLLVLEYFIAEAGEARRKNYRLFDSRKERLGSELFKTVSHHFKMNSSSQKMMVKEKNAAKDDPALR